MPRRILLQSHCEAAAIIGTWRAYWSEFLPEGRRFAPGLGIALGVGSVCGLLNVVYAITYVSLAFPGPLVAGLAPALSLGLLSAAVVNVVAALRLRYRGGMAVIAPEATLVIGSVGIGFADSVAPGQLQPTVLAAAAVVTCATAVTLYAVGRARLGHLMHYLPYPVVAGLMGGLGILLVGAGLDLAAPGLSAGSPAVHQHMWVEIALTAAGGTALWLLQHCRPSALNLPAMVLIGIGAFWLAAGSAASVEHWRLGSFPDDAIAGPEALWHDLAAADWRAIAQSAPTLAMLVAFLVVLVLADTASLEMALGRHLEPDQALRTLGAANAVSCGLGGFTGMMSISATIMAHRCHSPCRLVGLTAGMAALAVYFAGPGLFDRIPAFVVGGLIVFVGLEFVTDWFIRVWRRLSGPDRAILLAVVAGVSFAGFAVGFVVGLLLGFVLFVVSYSRLPAVRHETTGRYRFSHVERPEGERNRLRAEGEGTLILELGGFLFFGSAWRVYARIRRRALDPQAAPLRAVLLDFSRVSGVDSSGWHNFRKIADLAQQRGFQVVLTRLPPALERVLHLEEVTGEHLPHVRVLADLDHGLEWLEAATLECRDLGRGLAEMAASFGHDPLSTFPPERLHGFAERCSFAAGATLIAQGESSDDVYILRTGSISIAVEGPDGGRIRLRTAGPGTVVGEIAFILRRPRTAWAVADTAVTADRITRVAVARMAAEEPQLLVALQTAMLRILARRVTDSTELVVQLSR